MYSIRNLLGCILIDVIVNDDDDEIVFETSNGAKYKMYHQQDCCESVYIEDICGELKDLLYSPILLAEEVSCNDVTPINIEVPGYEETYTWTFYKLVTFKGPVTFRWFGSSNGYYSEAVDFVQIQEDK